MRYRFLFALLFAFLIPGMPVLSAIPLLSNTEAECNSEGGTCSINDAGCYRLNTSTTAPRYDPIGYCDGAARRNACCKVGATAAGPTPVAATPISTFNYETLEDIPGTARTANSGDFASYLQSLYRFTFFGIGIAALFMLTVGGFMYVTSAGNTSRVETAKTIITDSFLGILIALFAWLFLYVINPDLVQRMPVAAPLSTGTIGGGGGTTPPPTAGGTTPGSCQVAPSGPCSVSIMQSSCWGARNKAESASKVCMKESSNNPAEISKTDLCLDLKGFSVGLFQINLIANGYRIAPECRGENVFTLGDGSPMPPSLVPYNGRRTTQPNPYTPGRPEFNLFNCKVRDQALYNSCLSRAIETRKNIELGCTIYDAQGWSAWPYTFTTVCGGNL